MSKLQETSGERRGKTTRWRGRIPVPVRLVPPPSKLLPPIIPVNGLLDVRCPLPGPAENLPYGRPPPGSRRRWVVAYDYSPMEGMFPARLVAGAARPALTHPPRPGIIPLLFMLPHRVSPHCGRECGPYLCGGPLPTRASRAFPTAPADEATPPTPAGNHARPDVFVRGPCGCCNWASRGRRLPGGGCGVGADHVERRSTTRRSPDLAPTGPGRPCRGRRGPFTRNATRLRQPVPERRHLPGRCMGRLQFLRNRPLGRPLRRPPAVARRGVSAESVSPSRPRAQPGTGPAPVPGKLAPAPL